MQLVATDDIGVFAEIAFSNPEQFLNKTVELAGDELTETQIAEVFTKVIGRPVKLAESQNQSGAPPTEEQIAMFNFFNGVGYDADIPSLRALYPSLQNLEQHLRQNGWENAEPIPVPESGGNWG